jgi:hypothetical protein
MMSFLAKITYPFSFPERNIDGFYADFGDDPDIPNDIVKLVHDAMNNKKRRKKGVLSKSRFGTVGKIKPKQPPGGQTEVRWAGFHIPRFVKRRFIDSIS